MSHTIFHNLGQQQARQRAPIEENNETKYRESYCGIEESNCAPDDGCRVWPFVLCRHSFRCASPCQCSEWFFRFASSSASSFFAESESCAVAAIRYLRCRILSANGIRSRRGGRYFVRGYFGRKQRYCCRAPNRISAARGGENSALQLSAARERQFQIRGWHLSDIRSRSPGKPGHNNR